MKPKPLCPRTLRRVSRELRIRATKLRFIPGLRNEVTVGRANEADLWADDLLEQANRLEKARVK